MWGDLAYTVGQETWKLTDIVTREVFQSGLNLFNFVLQMNNHLTKLLWINLDGGLALNCKWCFCFLGVIVRNDSVLVFTHLQLLF